MRKLLQGIADFRRNRRADYAETFARLALAQRPDALLVVCSDSRVSPNFFASAEPGDLFVVRNIGNLVPPAESGAPGGGHSVPAAIEFALSALPIRDIVVCGHSECAAMRAIQYGAVPPDSPHLQAWLRHGMPPQEAGPAPAGLAQHDHLSQRNVLRQIDHLRTYPQVRIADSYGRLRLHAWWFDIAAAEVLEHDPRLRRFVPLDEARIAGHLARLD